MTVLEVLTARPWALCMECVITLTGLGADDAIDHLNALPLRVTEGRCDGCGRVRPMFARAGGAGASG